MKYLRASETDSADFREMEPLLQRLGINIVIERGEMHLEINEKTLKRHMTRYAGAKPKGIKINGSLSEITLEEARELIRVFGREEAGKYLGISGKTLYRKLKEAEELGWKTIF